MISRDILYRVCKGNGTEDEGERLYAYVEDLENRVRLPTETSVEPEDDPENLEIVAKLKAAFAGDPDARHLTTAMAKLADGAIEPDCGVAILTHKECEAVGKELRRLVRSARETTTELPPPSGFRSWHDAAEHERKLRLAAEAAGELEQWKQAVSRMRNSAATCLAVKPTSGMMRHTLEKLAGYDMVTCEHCGAETSWADVPCESCGKLPVKATTEPPKCPKCGRIGEAGKSFICCNYITGEQP